jgi:putative inorganic carbon (hco3(-)) transporter
VATGPALTARRPRRLPRPTARHVAAVVAGVAVAALGVASGAVVANAPVTGLVVVAAALVLQGVLRRPHLAVGLLAVSSFFDAYLTGGGFVTPAKLLGVLAGASWALAWLRGRQPLVLRAPLLWCGALLLWLVPSTMGAWDQATAIETTARYLMYVGLYFLLLQVLRDDLVSAERLLDYMIVAAAVSAGLGLYAFTSGTAPLASGPVEDPNDYAFLLASALPLALYRLLEPRRRALAVVACALILLAVLASFSRGAIVGLVVAAAWALASGRVRVRGAVVAALVLGLVAVVGYQSWDGRAETALEGKSAVADTNVQSRLTFWRVAVQQFQGSPVLGVGPGNYPVRYAEHELPQIVPGQIVTGVATHNTYLNILAEVGLPGLLFFLAFLVHSWILIRRPVNAGRERHYRTAVGAGLIVAATGAMFLTQQHYAPLWVLAALGAVSGSTADEPQAPVVERALP